MAVMARDLAMRISNFDQQGVTFTIEHSLSLANRIDKGIECGDLLGDQTGINFQRKSDTVFILGSGPSVDSLTKKNWDEVEKHDVIGFNRSDRLPVPQRLFIDQFILTGNRVLPHEREFPAARGAIFLMRGPTFIRDGLNDIALQVARNNNIKIFGLRELSFHSSLKVPVPDFLSLLDAMGFLKFGHLSHMVPKLGATIGLAIPLAFQMGYSRIVLVGIDMLRDNHSKMVRASKGRLARTTHPHMSFQRGMNMAELISQMAEWMWSTSGVQVMLGSKPSALEGRLNPFEFESPNSLS